MAGMTYEWAMTPIKDLRISSDNLGINAYYKDEVVSISWKEVLRAIDLYREDIMVDMRIKKFREQGWVSGP